MAAIGQLPHLTVACERLRRSVSEECYDKQQKAATLHDLRMPTRQSGRSAIRQYRRGLLEMHRRYRGGNGMRRVARVRTPRIRGRTSARLDQAVQTMTRKLHYSASGPLLLFLWGIHRPKADIPGRVQVVGKSRRSCDMLAAL